MTIAAQAEVGVVDPGLYSGKYVCLFGGHVDGNIHKRQLRCIYDLK